MGFAWVNFFLDFFLQGKLLLRSSEGCTGLCEGHPYTLQLRNTVDGIELFFDKFNFVFWETPYLKESKGHCSALTRKIAGIGHFGQYPGNCERDLFRLFNLPLELSFETTILVLFWTLCFSTTAIVTPNWETGSTWSWSPIQLRKLEFSAYTLKC